MPYIHVGIFLFVGSFEIALLRLCRAYNMQNNSVIFGNTFMPLEAFSNLSKYAVLGYKCKMFLYQQCSHLLRIFSFIISDNNNNQKLFCYKYCISSHISHTHIYKSHPQILSSFQELLPVDLHYISARLKPLVLRFFLTLKMRLICKDIWYVQPDRRFPQYPIQYQLQSSTGPFHICRSDGQNQ